MENQENQELLTAKEVLLKHGLDWSIGKGSVYDSQGRELTEFKAITRSDNGHVFQISRNKYTPISNEVGCGLLDEVVGTGMAKYTGASSFKNGGLVMVTAEVPELEYRIAGDAIKNYIHIATAHDGSMSTFIFGSQQRFRCQNLLTSQMKQDVCTLKFKHTKNYRIKIEDFKVVFSKYREAFQAKKKAFEAMAGKEMTRIELDSFLNQLLKLDAEKLDEMSTRSKNVKTDIAKLFTEGIGHEDMPDSRWKAFQAVTQYVTHDRSTRGDKSNREFANYFGSGAHMRNEAEQLLLV